MDEEQDLEGKANAKTLLAHALLAGSGGYGLSLSQPKFAGPAFGVSLVAGFIGFIANATGEDTLIKIHRYTSGLCRCLEVPLIAAEICLENCIPIELAALHLLYPSIHYLAKYIFKRDDLANQCFLETSHTISVCAIAYFNYINENWWGVGLAVVYAMSCFGQKIIDEPQMPTALLGIGNFLYILKAS